MIEEKELLNALQNLASQPLTGIVVQKKLGEVNLITIAIDEPALTTTHLPFLTQLFDYMFSKNKNDSLDVNLKINQPSHFLEEQRNYHLCISSIKDINEKNVFSSLKINVFVFNIFLFDSIIQASVAIHPNIFSPKD